MNQEAKLQEQGKVEALKLFVKNCSLIYYEFLLTNNACYSLFVGENRFSKDQNTMGENVLWSCDWVWYIRLILILRIIFSNQINKRSDTNLGREEKTVLDLDQSFLKASLGQEFNTKKAKRTTKER